MLNHKCYVCLTWSPYLNVLPESTIQFHTEHQYTYSGTWSLQQTAAFFTFMKRTLLAHLLIYIKTWHTVNYCQPLLILNAMRILKFSNTEASSPTLASIHRAVQQSSSCAWKHGAPWTASVVALLDLDSPISCSLLQSTHQEMFILFHAQPFHAPAKSILQSTAPILTDRCVNTTRSDCCTTMIPSVPKWSHQPAPQLQLFPFKKYY